MEYFPAFTIKNQPNAGKNIIHGPLWGITEGFIAQNSILSTQLLDL